jgi:NAD(P)-dependent dehydrogenase (short-subunit alcohol dehydrogenase family)
VNWGPFDLTGKNAVVTGGAMGIGFGIAKWFLQAGSDVLIIDVEGNATKKAAEKLSGGTGKVESMQADIAEEGVSERIIVRCVELFGSIDILVNNAGIYPVSPVLQMRPEFFDRVYKVNLKGLVFLSKAAATKMIQQGRGGKIINIASIDAFRPSMVGLAAYDASKGGVVSFTKSLALELAPYGITVNAIAPGAIETEGTSKPLPGMTAEQMNQIKKAFITRIPLGRMGVPDDIAKVCVFLASSASDYMTGETIIVDGGILIT